MFMYNPNIAVVFLLRVCSSACFNASIAVIDSDIGRFATVTGNHCQCMKDIEFQVAMLTS